MKTKLVKAQQPNRWLLSAEQEVPESDFKEGEATQSGHFLCLSLQFSLLNVANDKGLVFDGLPIFEEQQNLFDRTIHVRMSVRVKKTP